MQHILQLKVQEIEATAARASEVLGGEAQTLWAILRLSITQKFDYWILLVHPSLVVGAARRVDRIVRNVLERILGQEVPMEGEGLCYTCPLEGYVGNMSGRSFQSIVFNLPVKFGGLGLRGQEELSSAAFFGGLEQALPFSLGRGVSAFLCRSFQAVKTQLKIDGNLFLILAVGRQWN